ncbi:RecQ family ATP-dependent DNA helicase [Adhaeribacter radiodurans]|uniref:ATP-dependent DNA helicase RecQ n=1 Tax=Adhaeribacter radiodurans TaxID=2745197 RepID=A0A7L7L994_9BACT|nr:ATP-dependent DNA helicase RecQ [Adhaeribacter radiodurans]QMU29391.1 RecQ family ATP-dependent DNA helicase [Adhaeribacter radiodurans]
MELTIHQILQQFWHYNAFRPLQEDIIQSVLAGQDTLALLPTGGGKSICFQVPALAKPGICLVISPLIALMKDQVEQLQKRNIAAVAIHSGLSKHEIDIILDNCVFGQVKFLYVSPERLQTDIFRERVKRMSVSLLAVDEAHCISQWGYDFRPAYLQIAELRTLLPDIPVLALTATATEVVKQDIQDKLLFQKAKVFQQSFARANLSYSCLVTEDKHARLLGILQKVPGSAVVYVRSRRQTVETAKWLQARGISAGIYHAGLSFADRAKFQQQWIENRTRVIIATNAFGMGIDKPDVRLVIHLDLPETLEAYYQEAGRAGRGGKYSYATVLLGPADTEDLRAKVTEAHPPIDTLKRVYQALANYYQIAVGSGEFTSFDFQIDDFTRTYKLKALEVHHAIRKLESEGLLQLNEAFYAPSKLYFSVDHEELYKFQIAHHEFDALLKTLLRIYGGNLYSSFVKINERQIASYLQSTEAAVRKTLEYLSQRNIVEYEPQREAPQLLFTTPRYDAANLPLDKAKLTQFRKTAVQKAEAVINYLETTNRCRTQLLLQYFGEITDEYCRICDYCLARKKEQRKEDNYKILHDQIIAHLSQQPLHPKALVARFEPKFALDLTNIIRNMLEKGQLKYDNQSKLELIKS